MTLGTLSAHLVPLALLAALSPVMFVNSSRITFAQGRSRGLLFTAGAAVVVGLLGAATMGLMGKATHEWVERELASRAVDAALGLILIAYGAWQLRDARRAAHTGTDAEQATLPRGVGGTLYMGALGMITNFTTLPLVVSFSQRLGSSGLPTIEQSMMLVALLSVVLAPCWLPPLLDSLGVRTRRSTATKRPSTPQALQRRRLLKSAGSWVGIGACFVGGAVVLWHACGGLTSSLPVG